VKHVYRNPARVTVESGGSLDPAALLIAIAVLALLAGAVYFAVAYAAVLIVGMVAVVAIVGAGIWLLHRYCMVQSWASRAPVAAEAKPAVAAKAQAALPAGAPPVIEPVRILNIHIHGAAQPEGMAAALRAISEQQGEQR
jgi:hypothetical protein